MKNIRTILTSTCRLPLAAALLFAAAQWTAVSAQAPGTVYVEGAPGVEAVIDAFAQADSVANNNARAADNSAGVNIDGARIENNLFYGIRLSNNVRGTISHSHVTATGFRVSTAPTLGTTQCTNVALCP